MLNTHLAFIPGEINSRAKCLMQLAFGHSGKFLSFFDIYDPYFVQVVPSPFRSSNYVDLSRSCANPFHVMPVLHRHKRTTTRMTMGINTSAPASI